MKQRNYGIDFLKMLTMFMIVIIHIMRTGGVLENTVFHSTQYYVAWFLDISLHCAVDCFALTSGYLLVNSRIKLSRILELWLQIIFYTVSITGIMFFVFPETRETQNVINAIFPISNSQYWYLSAYFIMSIFVPIMNAGINNLERKKLRNTLLVALLFASILPTIFKKDLYMLNKGYSATWLCILYLLGGYIRKYDIDKKIKKSTAITVFLGANLFTFLSKIFIELRIIPGSGLNNMMFVTHISPTVIISGIALFSFCSKLKFKETGKQIIAFLSPAVLGVYLIHVHPLVFSKVFNGFAAEFGKYNCLLMLTSVILSAIIIYFGCILIELFRIELFKAIKIKELCLRIEKD